MQNFPFSALLAYNLETKGHHGGKFLFTDFDNHLCPSIYYWLNIMNIMMTSSNENIFWRYRPFVRGITKASDAELWYFIWSAPEQTVWQIIETLVIWDAMALIMAPLWYGAYVWTRGTRVKVISTRWNQYVVVCYYWIHYK